MDSEVVGWDCNMDCAGVVTGEVGVEEQTTVAVYLYPVSTVHAGDEVLPTPPGLVDATLIV